MALKQSYAEVMEEVANVSWQLMDAEQHATVATHLGKKVGKTTSDGVLLTWDVFGKALGTSGKALEMAAYRAKEGPSSTESQKAAERHARRIARTNPEAIIKGLDSEQRKALRQADRESTTVADLHALPAEAAALAERLMNLVPNPDFLQADVRETVVGLSTEAAYAWQMVAAIRCPERHRRRDRAEDRENPGASRRAAPGRLKEEVNTHGLLG
jgi:hypothetical protein